MCSFQFARSLDTIIQETANVWSLIFVFESFLYAMAMGFSLPFYFSYSVQLIEDLISCFICIAVCGKVS